LQRRQSGSFLSLVLSNLVEGGLKNWWIVAVVATAGDAGVEGVAAVVSAVGLRDQLGMGSQSFAAIFGYNLELAGTLCSGFDD
jgi:hypothetical protein